MKRITVLLGLAVAVSGSVVVAIDAQRRLRDARALQAAVVAAGVDDARTDAQPDAGGPSPRVLLARAIRLSRDNDTDAAERAFAAVLRRSRDAAVLRDARFGLANLYLRAGLQPALIPARAAALVEIAKQRYRDHLRNDPDDMDARWNLELALRAAPESDTAVDPDTGRPVKSVNVIVPDFAPTDLP